MAQAFCCILLSFLVGNARCRETKFTRNPKNCICFYGINWDLSMLTIKPSASNVWSNLLYFLLWIMHDQYVILLYNQTNTHLFQPAHNCFFITENICGADVNPNGRHANCILFAFIGDIDILCEWGPGDMHPLGPKSSPFTGWRHGALPFKVLQFHKAFEPFEVYNQPLSSPFLLYQKNLRYVIACGQLSFPWLGVP